MRNINHKEYINGSIKHVKNMKKYIEWESTEHVCLHVCNVISQWWVMVTANIAGQGSFRTLSCRLTLSSMCLCPEHQAVDHHGVFRWRLGPGSGEKALVYIIIYIYIYSTSDTQINYSKQYVIITLCGGPLAPAGPSGGDLHRHDTEGDPEGAGVLALRTQDPQRYQR